MQTNGSALLRRVKTSTLVSNELDVLVCLHVMHMTLHKQVAMRLWAFPKQSACSHVMHMALCKQVAMRLWAFAEGSVCFQAVRGKKTKAAKAKAKYADQDEEDRQLAMQLLASAGRSSFGIQYLGFRLQHCSAYGIA